MSRDREHDAVRCWECEAVTDRPPTVVLGAPSGIIGKLPLCPRCYEACYRPLARQPVDSEAPVRALLIVGCGAPAGRGVR